MNNFENIKHVHLVGIGGVGVSALALYFHAHNISVSGSDKQTSKQTELLQSKGITVNTGEERSVLSKEIDLLVYSRAVPEGDADRVFAQANGITELSYPEALGVLSNQFPVSIAVSGTNGKTTTTTMVAELLDHLKQKPNAIIGEISQKFKTNYIHGNDKIILMEACEYKDSFLNIHHNIAVITNISEDHLDYFKNLDHIKESFKLFVQNKKEAGILVCNEDDQDLSEIVDYARANNITVINYMNYRNSISVSVPGQHNIYNACAALGVIEALSLDIEKAKEYLASSFMGPLRRFEYLGVTNAGALIYDDYAHNPEGINLLVSALREIHPKKKIVMLFEPHLYSRTRDLRVGFISSLLSVDELYLLETYKAREEYNEDEAFLLYDELLLGSIPVHKVENQNNLVDEIKNKKYDDSYIIVSAGAGDVFQHTHQLIAQ